MYKSSLENIKFYLDPEDISDIQLPFCLLTYDAWDDFSRKTSFDLSFFNKDNSEFKIGFLKIMHETEFKTRNIMPKVFEELPEDFCSLGQDLDFYYNLKECFSPKNFKIVLDKLNDAAFHDAIGEKFEFNSNFRVSLIRNSEAQKMFKEAKAIIYDLPQEKNFNFYYNFSLENDSEIQKVHFNFGDNEFLPNRIISLIGKNGTGKTQFLAKFAMDLSGQSKNRLKNETFLPSRPLFSKVIAVSYSAFDIFTRPRKDKSFSYKYCGLKDENGRLLSSPRLVEKFSGSALRISPVQKKLRLWYNTMANILGIDLADHFYDEIFENHNYEIVNYKNSKLLSSGQNILMYVFTEIIAEIKENSILLFDEPEMHLHPNAVANFIRMLEDILFRFDSYAIIATHSPIILQEIPGRYVNIFDRQGNIPMIYKLGTESFGENVDVLTEIVFKTMEVEDNFKIVLKKLSKEHSFKKVLSFFDDNLSMSASTFLLNQYENPEKELNA